MVSLSRHLTLRLTDEEMAVLDAGCRSLGLNRSAFLRFALREAVKGAESKQRLTSIERTLAEILDLLRGGSLALKQVDAGDGERDDGIREELAQSLRGILAEDF